MEFTTGGGHPLKLKTKSSDCKLILHQRRSEIQYVHKNVDIYFYNFPHFKEREEDFLTDIFHMLW